MQKEQFSNASMGETHTVANQSKALVDVNLFSTDPALEDGLRREGAGWSAAAVTSFGALVGSAEVLEWGFAANKHPPTLATHDHYGYRVDEVSFHPAYHALMRTSLTNGLHASHWLEEKAGAHVARAAKFYLMSQAEAAHCCPVTMTAASIAALKDEEKLVARWKEKILALDYDPRNIAPENKTALTVGMAMTEKQGGSDVRANATTAQWVAYSAEEGEIYVLTGHKYFVSAPMSDLFLVLAQAPGGLTCFLLPRWLADGTKNPIQLQALKPKMGNVANASSETELRGALAWRVGDEGAGLKVILKMVAATRVDCMLGSAAGMRTATVQAIHHCRTRRAFGLPLASQPLMQNVLADLALESEAALALSLRVARAMDESHADPQSRAFLRVATAIGKYWICRRTASHVVEAMECIGGSGVMETSVMPRLFRESPINSIWEGSGNIQCLDVLRVLDQSEVCREALLSELQAAVGLNRQYDAYAKACSGLLHRNVHQQRDARILVEKIALALQASLLIRYGPSFVAEAFCCARLAPEASMAAFGRLPDNVDLEPILERVFVQ